MKAFLWESYGPPEALRMAEVEKPAPGSDEALVKVLGVSVNPGGLAFHARQFEESRLCRRRR